MNLTINNNFSHCVNKRLTTIHKKMISPPPYKDISIRFSFPFDGINLHLNQFPIQNHTIFA